MLTDEELVNRRAFLRSLILHDDSIWSDEECSWFDAICDQAREANALRTQLAEANVRIEALRMMVTQLCGEIGMIEPDLDLVDKALALVGGK